MRTLVTLLCLAAVTARGATFPGAPPCNTTLQACVDGTAPGGTVEVGVSIDQDVTIRKTLDLTSVPGTSPVIGGGVTHRMLTIQDAGPGGGIVQVRVSNLILNNAEVHVTLANDAGHSVEVSGLDLSHSVGGDTGQGIGVDVGVPATVVVRNNDLASPGDVIRLSANLSGGEATLTALANRVSTFNPFASHDGVAINLSGGGTVVARVYSNLVHGVSGCNCRTAAGIDVSSAGAVVAAVDLVNNTVDDIRVSSNGIQVRLPKDTAQLMANVFNNIVTNATKAGIAILSQSNPQLALNNGFNDFFANAVAEDFGGYAPGPMTLHVDPLYVGGGNYRLQGGSPVIDAGAANPPGGLPEVDADEHLRTAGAAPDLGAYEFGSLPAVTTTTIAATTTTTLPACAGGAGYPSLECRLDALIARVRADVPAGSLSLRLQATSTRARANTAAAEVLAGRGRRQAVRASLGRAIRALGRFAARLRSPAGTQLAAPLRQDLLALARGLRADLRALRVA